MNILVTGATGFIGSAVTRLAQRHGHRIGALVRPGARPLLSESNFVRLEGTLENPPWELIKKFQPEVCLHAAWIATPGVYLESRANKDYLRWSVELPQRLRSLGLRRFLGLGTCIEYRIAPNTRALLHEERTPIAPQSEYARCKNALRVALQEQSDLETCWGRIFYPYGPEEHPERLCSTLIRKLRSGEELELRTPDSTKDYIFIDDLAEAILLLATSNVRGAINLGTGIGISVREIAQSLGLLLGRGHLIKAAAQPAPDPYSYVVADAGKLRTLGWQPRTNLSAGLTKLLASLASNQSRG